MYWSKQEQFIFDVILLVPVAFQIATVSLYVGNLLENGILLVGINLILLIAMIPYAKWVWKIPTFQKAFLQVVKREMIMLGVIGLGILLAMLMRRMKLNT